MALFALLSEPGANDAQERSYLLNHSGAAQDGE